MGNKTTTVNVENLHKFVKIVNLPGKIYLKKTKDSFQNYLVHFFKMLRNIFIN